MREKTWSGKKLCSVLHCTLKPLHSTPSGPLVKTCTRIHTHASKQLALVEQSQGKYKNRLRGGSTTRNKWRPGSIRAACCSSVTACHAMFSCSLFLCVERRGEILRSLDGALASSLARQGGTLGDKRSYLLKQFLTRGYSFGWRTRALPSFLQALQSLVIV